MKAYVASGIDAADPLSVFAYRIDHPEPTVLPTDTTVLVHVVYAGVNPADLQYVNGQYEHAPAHPMPTFPAPMGVEGAGIVVKVGAKVTKFKPGDHVMGLHRRMDEGTFAEVAAFEEDELAYKPPTVSWQLAAATPVAGVTALSAFLCCPVLKAAYKNSAVSALSCIDGSLAGTNGSGSGPAMNFSRLDAAVPASPVKSVLILGASGGVGSFAVLLAKHFFHIPLVLATCSGRNAVYVQKLGADVTIDYTAESVEHSALQAVRQFAAIAALDPNKRTASGIAAAVVSSASDSPSSAPDSPRSNQNSPRLGGSSKAKLDLIIDNVGGSEHMSMACRMLSSSGMYVTSVPLADPQDPSLASVLSFFVNLGVKKLQHKVAYSPAVAFNGARSDGLKVQRIADWLAANPVIGGSGVQECLLRLTEYDLADAGKALAALLSKRVVGKLVLRVSQEPL